MARRLLMIEGDEKHLSLVEKLLIEKGGGILSYAVVDIGYDYDYNGGWSFTRFKLDGFVEAIPIEWMKKYIEETFYYDSVIGQMIADWERENEESN